ncbi:MAG TPA: nitrilase-related carbon-nitrogen hydrolase [candidate division Zixibacteria bacterium]|nr:nitrilase-related carbon-nitrogen hydrolase [candidate division Zixibacteria bacterium]
MVQKDIKDLDITGHLERAKGDNPDLVCFSELAATGCLYHRRPVTPLEKICETLSPFNFGVMLGLPVQEPGGFFNSYLFYERGKYRLYHKINLFPPFGEPQIYESGHRIGLFETATDRLGTAICYDLRFEDIFTRLAEAGARKIFVPAAFPIERIDDYRDLLIKRAVDFNVHIIGINAVGSDDKYQFGGNSMVVAPDGSILAEAGRGRPETLTVEI